MRTRTRAGASARPAARKRASASPKSVAQRRKPAPRKKPAPRRNGATEHQRVTPWGVITVRSGRPLAYTPELNAHARYRFEETSESAYSIATDLGMHHTSLKRLAQREGWVRRNPRQARDITPVMRLAAAVDAMTSAAPHPNPLPASGEREPTEFAAPPPLNSVNAPDTSAIDRLEAAVMKELAVVERMRAALGPEPLRPFDAQVTARTLSSLTETLAKLRRLRLGSAAQNGPHHDDDMPADIDEFRNELARRIDAFVASRTDAGDAERGSGPAVVDALRP